MKKYLFIIALSLFTFSTFSVFSAFAAEKQDDTSAQSKQKSKTVIKRDEPKGQQSTTTIKRSK